MIKHKTLLQSVKHSGGNIMSWDCFAAYRRGLTWLIENNCEFFCKQILQENAKVSICELKLNRKLIVQQDNYSFQALSHKSDLNAVEILWKDMKNQHPWAEAMQCAGLINHQHLV